MIRQPLHRLALAIVLLCGFVVSAHAETTTTYIEGHGGVPLAVTVTGPEDGPEILFLHGVGMGADSFSPQLTSELADKFRMVAFDLRGHGMSGKPAEAEAYVTREVWAEDVARVMAATGLKRPVIVGWSYGTLVTADYVFEKGTDTIAGVMMIGAHGSVAPPAPPEGEPDPAIMELMSEYYQLRGSAKFADQSRATRMMAPYLYEVTTTGPSEEWRENAHILGLMMPPYAQPHLRAHPNDNAGLAEALAETPLMLVTGTKDLGMSEPNIVAAKAAWPHLEHRSFQDGGHAPFAESPEQFNAVLALFVERTWQAPQN